MNRQWLIGLQILATAVALYMAIGLFRPELGWRIVLPFGYNKNAQNGSEQILTNSPSEDTESSGLQLTNHIDRKGIVSYSDAAAKAMPAVVSISTSKNKANAGKNDPLFDFLFGGQEQNLAPGTEDSSKKKGLGSGVIVSHDGYILTNNHVISDADQISVQLSNGKKLPAELIGTDPESDLAVIRAKTDTKLPQISFGNDKALLVGDVVLAIGNPYGVGQTVTMGIVSAIGRQNLQLSTFENFIQTDAAINPGNSGGALIDTQGNLLGINTAIFSKTGGSNGIGFAIPTSLARRIMDSLIKNGKVTRGYLGVEVRAIEPGYLINRTSGQPEPGVLVSGVAPGKPADQAGIQPGDILQKINQTPITSDTVLLNEIAKLSPGTVISVALIRKGKRVNLSAKVGERPKAKPTISQTSKPALPQYPPLSNE